MKRTTRQRVEAACASLALLLASASAASAQGVPRRMKNLKREDRAAWREVLRWPDACEAGYEESYSPEETYGGLEFHRLGRGLHLVEVTCDGGGIQPSTVFMVYDGRRASPLKLKGFEGKTEVRALTKFAPRSRELMLMSKADAMGTCGLFVRYRFARGRPVVVEARRQDDCGGPHGTPDTDRWPRVRLKE